MPVGGRAEVTLHIRSTGRLPTGGLLVADGVPYSLGGKPRFVIEHLPRHTGTRLRYRVQPMLRGIQQLGPLKATITDPFGLAEFERELAHTSRLIVVPRVVKLAGVPGGSGLGSGDDGSVRLRRRARARTTRSCARTGRATTCARCTGARPPSATR